MHRFKITFLLFLIFTVSNIKCVYSQLSGIQISYIKPQVNFEEVFLPSFSFEVYSFKAESNDQFKYGMSVGITLLNASKDTIAYSLHSRRIFERCYEFEGGLLMSYNLRKEDFSPFVGLDLYVMGVKYNYTQVPPFYYGSSKEIEFGISAIPKIGISYVFLKDYLLTFGGGYAFRYKLIEGKKESFLKYFISIGYFL